MSVPLAYHLTWTAYGTWLHGDPRGWVESGVPCVQPPDEARLRVAQARMIEPPVTVTSDQRTLIEQVVAAHCAVRGWHLHALNARSNHVHVVVTADRAPEEVMDQFKAWCSRRLSDAEGLAPEPRARGAGRRKCFAERGSTKWVNDEDYFASAIRYVRDCQ